MKKASKLRLLAAASLSAMVAACMTAAPALAYTPTISNGGALTVNVGDQVETEEVYYKYGANASVTYTSSDTSVATVAGDKKGTASVSINGWSRKSEFHYTLVTAVGPGSATITATDSTGIVGTYRINVNKMVVKIPVIPQGGTYSGGGEHDVLKSTDAYMVYGATVKDAGTYNIIVTLNDSRKYMWEDGTSEPKEFTFTVAKAANTMSAYPSYDELKMKPNKVQYTKIKTNAHIGKVTFKSATKKVKVDKNGKVTIPKGFKGTVKINVTDAGDKNHVSKTVTVKFKVRK